MCPLRLQSSCRWAGPRSQAAVRGVVAAHSAAEEVSLRQCGRQLRNPAQFQAMWAALAAGSAARRTGVPLSAVDAKNCGFMEDEDVIELCATLPELRCASNSQQLPDIRDNNLSNLPVMRSYVRWRRC